MLKRARDETISPGELLRRLNWHTVGIVTAGLVSLVGGVAAVSQWTVTVSAEIQATKSEIASNRATQQAAMSDMQVTIARQLQALQQALDDSNRMRDKQADRLEARFDGLDAALRTLMMRPGSTATFRTGMLPAPGEPAIAGR